MLARLNEYKYMKPPKIVIEKSPIPIVWLDTSIITKMCMFRHTPDKLEPPQRCKIERLYNLVYEYGRAGKIICPLADQEGEVWAKRDEWMDTIRDISLGIECVSIKEVQENQQQKAMAAYLAKAPSIRLSYMDAFHKDPVKELKEKLRQPFFLTVNYGIIFGEEYHRKNNKVFLEKLNLQRTRNVSAGTKFETQLRSELSGEISAIIEMVKALANGNVQNEEEEFNAFCATINLNGQLAAWEYNSGKLNDLDGLIAFHRSDYNTMCPYHNLSCNLYAKIMIDPQPIRSGDPMDISHISTLMPYSDLFITDNAWSTFLNKKDFNKVYNTTVCYIGDSEVIDDFFRGIDKNNG